MAMKVHTITGARIDEVTATKEKKVVSIENDFKRLAPLSHGPNMELSPAETEAEATHARFAAEIVAMRAKWASRAWIPGAPVPSDDGKLVKKRKVVSEVESTNELESKFEGKSEGKSKCQNCGESFTVDGKSDSYGRVMLFCSSACFEY